MKEVRAELVRPLAEALREHAARTGGRTAFRDGRRDLTWAQLELRTARLAGHLARLGVHRGDRVLLCLPSRVEMVESSLAALRAAAVGVPLDPGASDDELAHVLADSGAVAVVAEAPLLERLTRMAAGRHPLRTRVVVGPVAPQSGASGSGAAGAPDSAVPYEELAGSDGTDAQDPPRDDLGLDEPAWILYTSGTTGARKGAVTSQRAALWSTAAGYAPLLGMSDRDRLLWPLPTHHAYAHSLCVVAVVATGASARLLDRGVDIAETLRSCPSGEPFTILAGVPATYHLLVSAIRRTGPVPGGLRMCVTAGAPCPTELRASVEELLGAPLLDGYGATETSGKIALARPGAPGPDRVPRPLPGTDVRIAHPVSTDILADGGEGELWVRGPGLMTGYHNRPDDTARVLRDGWYRTGDLGHRTPEGGLRVTGRVGDLIIRGGQNINPVEVEQVLLSCPGVADAAVVGRPHDVLGEVPVAFVVLAAQDTDLVARDPGLAGQDTGLGGHDAGPAGRDPGFAGQDADLAQQGADRPGQDTDLVAQSADLAGQDTGLAGHETDPAGRDPGFAGQDADLAQQGADRPGQDTSLAGQDPDPVARDTVLAGPRAANGCPRSRCRTRSGRATPCPAPPPARSGGPCSPPG
ncbi:class I adenylate-forming enzyme family protein [Streptomyces uncialis]|uniref:class I adenylate-forming enzyme family protein n=1 Tax=Streptomyces uncialis TaxID=1048205 RepID=UPI00386A76F8|nr:acyl--CoA ligase [Streptomyces uncialis]